MPHKYNFNFHFRGLNSGPCLNFGSIPYIWKRMFRRKILNPILDKCLSSLRYLSESISEGWRRTLKFSLFPQAERKYSLTSSMYSPRDFSPRMNNSETKTSLVGNFFSRSENNVSSFAYAVSRFCPFWGPSALEGK